MMDHPVVWIPINPSYSPHLSIHTYGSENPSINPSMPHQCPIKPLSPLRSHLSIYPSSLHSGNLTQLLKITILNGKIHYKWPCSIAMLVTTRGYPLEVTGKNDGLFQSPACTWPEPSVLAPSGRVWTLLHQLQMDLRNMKPCHHKMYVCIYIYIYNSILCMYIYIYIYTGSICNYIYVYIS